MPYKDKAKNAERNRIARAKKAGRPVNGPCPKVSGKCRKEHFLTPENLIQDGQYLRCRECRRQQNNRTYWKHRDSRRLRERVRSWLRQGIEFSLEGYSRLWTFQDGKCAVCKKAMELYDKDACVDHNHSTGQIRGILCQCCNRSIGLMKDNIDILQAAIEYLKERS